MQLCEQVVFKQLFVAVNFIHLIQQNSKSSCFQHYQVYIQLDRQKSHYLGNTPMTTTVFSDQSRTDPILLNHATFHD